MAPAAPQFRPRRPRPTLAATLTAAALAGELVVATLVGADDAHAQIDEPRPPDVSAAADPSGSTEPPADEPDAPVEQPDELPDEAPVELPPVEAPPEPAASSAPALPSAPIAAAPVRTGHDASVAPLAAPRTARADDDEVAEASRRTGGEGPARPASAPPEHDGRTRAPGPRTGANRGATGHTRARRPASARPGSGASAAEGALPALHTIAPGEHLWGIAAARVGQLTRRDPATIPAEEIAPYWTRLCMTNEARLRSGNVSLVYPGEVVELPPT
ncbi:MAG TPA: hypothetical protein VIH82_14120 [Acidimicrobiia bacterium]